MRNDIARTGMNAAPRREHEILGRPDQPMTARQAAEQAAEAVRTLNHLTMAPPSPGTPGWEDLGDVYATLGELRLPADRLPQILRQLGAVFDDPGVDVRAEDGLHPADVILEAGAALRSAGEHARELGRWLATAHNAYGHLYVERHVSVAADPAGRSWPMPRRGEDRPARA